MKGKCRMCGNDLALHTLRELRACSHEYDREIEEQRRMLISQAERQELTAKLARNA